MISGPGAATLAVKGNSTSQVFHIGARKTVSISGLTIKHGTGALNGSGLLNDHAVLTVDSCVVRNNLGGIYNDGNGSGGRATLTILNSAIIFNHADNAGGGIYNDASGDGGATLTITNSNISNNAVGLEDDIPLVARVAAFTTTGE